MTREEYDTLKHQSEVLGEVEKRYPSHTIDNVIKQIESRIKLWEDMYEDRQTATG